MINNNISLTNTNFYKENEQLTQAGNLLKGYVNFLKKKTIIGLEKKENIININKKKTKRKDYLSSKNLKIINESKKKKKYEKKTNKRRRLSYNIDNSGILNISPITILRKNNSLRPEIVFEFKSSKKNYQTPKKKLTSISSTSKENIPLKSYSNNIKIFNEKTNKSQNSKLFQEKNELFSLLKKPLYFKGENNDSNSIILDNDKSFSLTGISNKNILELNEIRKELKDTFLGKSIIQELSKKSFIIDDIENFESPEINISNTINKLEKEKYRILIRKGYVYDSFDEDESLDEMEIYNNLNPDSFIVKCKDFLVFISVFYNLVYLPIFLAYNNIYCYSGNYVTYENIIENFIDIIFYVDMIITFFVGFYNFDEILILDYKSIAKNYFKSWFFIDLISAIPIKTLLTIFNKKCYNEDFLTNPLYNHNFYYLLILIRLIKTVPVINKNKFLQYLKNKLSKFDKYNKYFQLLISLIIFFFSIHIVSCIFIFIGKNEYPNWIINFNHQNKSFIELYLIAIYYTIETITTVGYGDIFCTNVTEKIFGLIMEIFGIVAYSWALTAMINYVKIFTDKEEELYLKFRILDEIKLTYPQLNDDLYDRIHRFLKYKHESEKKDCHIVFKDLPVTLRNSLIYEMYKPMINSFIFFKNFSNSDFIVKIILALKPILALKNDVLIKDGDFVEDIIFVKKGKLSLELPLDLSSPKKLSSFKKRNTFLTRKKTSSIFKTSSFNFKPFQFNVNNSINRVQTIENKEYIQHYRILQIRKNEHFGDILMFLNQRSPLCLKVISKKVELFFLNKSDAINISNMYPQYWKRINKKSLFNMEQIKRLTNKITRIIKNIYGNNAQVKKHIKRIPSVFNNSYIEIIEGNDYELKSIPSINDETEINNTLIYDDIKNTCLNFEKGNDLEKNKRKKKQQKNLKTIIEDENYSSNSSSHSSSYSSSQSISSNSISSNFSKYNSKNNTISTKKKIINKNNLLNKGSITPYSDDEINNEIYPEETFIITGNSNIINNKNIVNKNIFNNHDNISICSTESFSISSEYENINELYEYKYSKNKKLMKKLKNFIKEDIFKSKSLTKSITSMNSESYDKSSSVKQYSNNQNFFKKNSNKYEKNTSTLNLVPKNLNLSFGIGFKNIDNENLNRNNSGNITNLKVNKMLSYDGEQKFKHFNSKKEKKKEILDVIGNNIEKNLMILKNPEQFYSEFFIDVMNKKNNYSNLLTKNEELKNKFEKNNSIKEKVKKNYNL